MILSLTLLRINTTDVSRLELLFVQLGFFFNALLVSFGQIDEPLQTFLIPLPFLMKVRHFQRLRPHVLMEVHQHVFLESSFPVVDADAVVVAVQPVDESLYGGFVEMTDVRCSLSWFVAHHQGLRIDQTESINDNLSFD